MTMFHSSNASGPYTEDAIKSLPHCQVSDGNYDPGMTSHVTDTVDKDEMVLTMKATKKINPTIATYFYMNSWKDCPQMTHEMIEHPN